MEKGARGRKASSAVMRRSPGGSRTIKRAVRKRTATIVQKEDGTKRYRFPMPDPAHARNALARLRNAKGLNQAQKLKIFNRAARILNYTAEERKASRQRIFGAR